MTLEKLQDRIDGIVAWRKKELSCLLENVKTAKDFSQSVAIRTGYVLTYAHFEGAIKHLASLYLEYVSSQNIEFDKLTMNFLLIGLKENDLKLLFETNKIEKRIEIIRKIFDMKTSTKLPFKNIIDTESNLKSEILRNILNTVNFDKSKYELDYNFIDSNLLKTRNLIAHGDKLDSTCTFEQFEQCNKKVLKLIDDFSKDVYDYAKSKRYLKINLMN